MKKLKNTCKLSECVVLSKNDITNYIRKIKTKNHKNCNKQKITKIAKMEDKKCYYYSEEKEKEVDKFCISKARLISDLNKYRGLLDEMKKESEYLDDTYLADDMDVYIADEMYCLERKMDDYQKWIKLMEKAFKFPGGFNKYTDALNVELEIKRNENKRTELLEQVNNVESKQKILKQELKKMLASEDQ